MQAGNYRSSYKITKMIPLAIIALGIVLRLMVYLQNRNLWTDEINIALNIAERNFAELATPLSYGQYAPPIFLWFTKLSAILFGMGEQALRLYPLLTGIGALLLLHNILRKNLSIGASWYPLLLFATGIFYLRYSTEVKQYMPDAFISLWLVWLALRVDLLETKLARFVLIWIAVGSIAIWSSMPSVFVLAGVGCYYGVQSLQHKEYKKLLPLLTIAAIWLGQFLIYYFAILSQQISSDFLVNYHDRYFLSTNETWAQNRDVIKAVLQTTYGGGSWALYVNCILLVIGVIGLAIRNKAKTLLLVLPVLLMLLAALLKQYSLIPRLTLFSMPLLLILTGYGLTFALSIRRMPLQAVVLFICLGVWITTEPLKAITTPIQEENFTKALGYLQGQNMHAEHIYVYTGAVNAYRYYTDVHPDKQKWQQLHNPHYMTDGTDVHKIAETIPEKSAMVYTIAFDSYSAKELFRAQVPLTDSFETDGCSVFIFER